MTRAAFGGVCLFALAITCTPCVSAGPVVPAQFNANTLARNDDGSTGSVGIGFTINFFGANYSNLYVNNNGNVTFTGPLSTFTPFPIVSNGTPMIAPFFADVDTRNPGSAVVTYGAGVFEGRTAFGVNWVDVGFFSNQIIPTNSFQLILQDRSDINTGDFDIIFNYDRVLWETGQASGGNASGLGGSSARVGYTNGVGTSFEFAGSAVNGALLDGGPAATALIHNSLNAPEDGRYRFAVRNGQVINDVPEPSSIALATIGGLSLAGYRLRRRSNAATKN
jgi:hypothetical protein